VDLQGLIAQVRKLRVRSFIFGGGCLSKGEKEEVKVVVRRGGVCV
jgi:hypothetical protein